ncbi:ABC transporter permease [Salinispirillum sp. LH 10-3-1]|uniref:ABC transporter permease n=1 Tax=Salinispirillum sp. LH 10-3-1 TaxID=2952525 RepID=A0AB38YGG9_9GAMM
MNPTHHRPSRVIPVLSGAAVLCLLTMDYAVFQANRIVAGDGQSLWLALGYPWAGALVISLLGLMVLSRLPSLSLRWSYAIVMVLLMQMPLSLSWFGHFIIPTDQPFARSAPAAGFWLLLFFALLLALELQHRLQAGRLSTWSMGLLVMSAWWLCVQLGWLDSLALVREYRSQSGPFAQALHTHLLLVIGAVGASALLSALLTAVVLNYTRTQNAIFAVLNFFQTIPSLALFGLLIAPLSALSAQFPWLQALGIRGIGWAPAMIALIAYSLLPMVRNTTVALQEVSASVLESARGMGMSRAQIFLQVRLPLALPVIIEGLRITTIQAIGLTAVAALIGAGGFGTFIFQGLGQAAMDLVLLGALPTIALAMLADVLLTTLARFTSKGQPT